MINFTATSNSSVTTEVKSSLSGRTSPPDVTSDRSRSSITASAPSYAATAASTKPATRASARAPRQRNEKPKIAIVGTSLVRGLGHKLNKRGFDVSSFMYPGAEIPAIRERVHAIFPPAFQPDVVVLQCAGNDIMISVTAPSSSSRDSVRLSASRNWTLLSQSRYFSEQPPLRGQSDTLQGEIAMVNTFIENMSKRKGSKTFCSGECPKQYRIVRKDAVHFDYAGKSSYAFELSKVLGNFPRMSIQNKR